MSESGSTMGAGGAEASIDAVEFRRALGCFVTGITVVTTLDTEGTPRGFTANSFTSVSLDPPLVLVCIGYHASSYPVFQTCERFAINVLAEAQTEVSAVFASKVPDKFNQVEWHRGVTGAPVIDGAVATFECEPWNKVDAGDHLVLIGKVISLGYTHDQPLGFCRGNYLSFQLEQDAVMRSPDLRVELSCILEKDDSILLVRDGDGWTLPQGSSDADETGDLPSLRSLLDDRGVRAEIGFLFSVFEDIDAGRQLVVYRGEIVAGPPVGMQDLRLFAFEDIPWDALPSRAHRRMVRRYIREKTELGFGIYVGSSRGGVVGRLGGNREPPAATSSS